jgi:hypothetical protein
LSLRTGFEVEQLQQLAEIGYDIGKILPPRTIRPRGLFLSHPAQSRSFGMIDASKEIGTWLPTT